MDAATEDAGKVQQYNCNGVKGQRWQVSSGDSAAGCSRIKVAGTDQCLDVRDQEWDQWGGKVQRVKCNDSPNQQWQISSNGSGRLRFVSRRNGLCLDARDQEIKPGGRIQMMICNDADNQKWVLE